MKLFRRKAKQLDAAIQLVWPPATLYEQSMLGDGNVVIQLADCSGTRIRLWDTIGRCYTSDLGDWLDRWLDRPGEVGELALEVNSRIARFCEAITDLPPSWV